MRLNYIDRDLGDYKINHLDSDLNSHNSKSFRCKRNSVN